MNRQIADGWMPDPDSEVPFEDQTKLRLTEWFESYGANVYWEKEAPYGRTTFASLHTAEKPDLLVEHTNWPTIAYEVKIGNDGTAIYDGALQTVRYWRRFERNHEEYTVNETIYTPDVFALATGNAQFGRLYDDARVKDKFKFDLFTSSGRKKGAEHGQVPKHEYASSETTLRLMWRFMEQYAADEDLSSESGVGALYSDGLDKSPEDLIDQGAAHDPGICYKHPAMNPKWRILR